MNPSKLEYVLRGTFLYTLLGAWIEREAARDWKRTRRPPAPRTLKQRLVTESAERHGYRTLVETGTFYGDMIAAARGHFDRIVSIELSPRLHAKAVARFAGCPDVRLVLGDSAVALPGVLDDLDGPALFWLDGHYSGHGTARGDEDTPVRKELAAILGSTFSDHLVLIDDARLFGSDPAYPSLSEVESLVSARRPDWAVSVSDDVVRIGRADRIST